MKTSTQSITGRVASKTLIKTLKKNPSQLIKDQSTGKSIIEQFPKPKIIQFLNIGDNSIHTDSDVHVDEPLFAPIPHVIQFTNYEPLQTKTAVLTFRNKDKVARSIKVIPPDSKLFSVLPAKKSMKTAKQAGTTMQSSMTIASDIDQMSTKVAPGMEITYIVKFFPEAKSDYAYDLMVMTEREKFIVPIRARGCKAMLDFPDQLDFGLVPVKFETEKPVLIRNVGEKTTKWSISVPKSFKINQCEGILEVGQIAQVVFHFVPQEARKYTEELTLTYDGLEAQIPCIGEAHNDNVYLSKSHIHSDPTSITLYSHQYFQIVNKSAVPIEFSWRAFAAEIEEQNKKARVNLQLSQEEQEEREEIENAIRNGEDTDGNDSLDSDDSYDEKELAAKQERRRERALATMSRKYTSIRKAVDEDKMLFQDEIFQIEPLEGKIWPNTEMTCCVTFRPQGPYHYSSTAYANVTCNQERLALNLTGQGKGPQAQLSITEMDIGDIFVTSTKTFDLGIENTGEIDCHWKQIEYGTPFGSKFKFSKTEGTLGVQENIRDLIRVTFMSDILGEFSETFRFALEGSSEMLTLTFKGHVVAPTFKFSEDLIDFGKVSYKFSEKKTVFLTNTSEVDINYVVRVPGDGRGMQSEFIITKNTGTLGKNEKAQIEVEFIPCFPQIYDMVLVVDLVGVGQDMLAVPIKAQCLVPKVKVQPDQFLDFGNCFLKYPRTEYIKIINQDNLRARFQISPQDEQSKRMGIYDVDMWNGVIEPNSTQTIQVKLRTEILQVVRINLPVKLDGHHMPTTITLQAFSRGPDIKPDQDEMDWGSVRVLDSTPKYVKIKNEAQIDAEYTAFTKNKDSIWKVQERYGVLKPFEEKQIKVICTPDEEQRFQDTLHIIVNNGTDLEVQLKAKGYGTTLYNADGIDKGIDFGTEYTFKNIPKQYFLENRGRKPLKISWIRQAKMERKKRDPKAIQAEASATKASGIGVEEKKEEDQQVFTVVPDQITLGPKMGIMVEFRAFSQLVGKITEQFLCQTITGSERSKPREVWRINVTANFTTPTLQFDKPKLDFKYLWEKGVLAEPIYRPLKIKNTGHLKTTLSLKIEPPFNCTVEKLTLEPEAEDTIQIDFDPGMKQDKVSDHINGKLAISHEGHPQKNFVDLQGEVCFPNLQILPPKIDFGTILNDTSKKKYLVLTNVSEMAVAYEWSFLEDAPILDEQDEIDEDNAGKKKKKKKKKHLPINEVFDILPVSGILQPGQTENVEFTFYSGSGLTYNGMAVCSCDGGPDYDVPISGSSHVVSFKLSTNHLDFGEVPYTDTHSKDFYIENIGKVPFEFSINLKSLTRPGVVECSVMQGKVLAHDKFRVTVKFNPGIPDNITEKFYVECGHFPAEPFTIQAVGIYPSCLISLPRVEEKTFNQRFNDVKGLIETNAIQYSALFRGADSVVPSKTVQYPSVLFEQAIKESPHMEIEAECDRQLLCRTILDIASDSTHDAFTSRKSSKLPEFSPRSMKSEVRSNGSFINLAESGKNFIASYVCDFGNVIQTKVAKRSFRLTNVGKRPINFNFDAKIMNNAGIQIDPNKVAGLAPHTSMAFNVTYTTRKTSRLGKQKYLLPVEVKDGPNYMIEFLANITIPELSMSQNNLDFDKVCVNTRKTIKIRFENKKEVACDWSFSQKYIPAAPGANAGKEKKEKEVARFSVFPTSGSLQPGAKQTVDVMFIPSADKPFEEDLLFKCHQNPKPFTLKVKGQGINFTVDIIPETIKLGPVLPYDTSAIKAFEIRNPMDQAIEIYSLDFDKQYIEEEEILKRIENFQPNGSGEYLFLPMREAGNEFWPQLKVQDETKRAMAQIKEQIHESENQIAELELKQTALDEYLEQVNHRQENPKDENGNDWPALEEPQMKQEEISEERNRLTKQKGEQEAQLTDILTSQTDSSNVIPALKDEKKINVILVGPQQCGRSTTASYMAAEHKRCLIQLDKLYEFWQKRGGALAEEASAYLMEQEVKLQEAIAEAEKKKKQKKPKKGEEEKELDPREFKYLPRELLLKMLQKRLQDEDCNAGAIFDCLTSEYWPDEKFAIDLICEAAQRQNVLLVLFDFNKEVDGDTEMEVCTNYRYARRHDPVHLPVIEEMSKSSIKTESEPSKTKKVNKTSKGKRNVPEPEKSEAELKAIREAEEEKRLKEVEIQRKKNEAEARAAYKPKDYSQEEKEAWREYKQEIMQFFAELVMKHSNVQNQPSVIQSENPNQEIAQEEEKVEDDVQNIRQQVIFGERFIKEQFIQYDFTFLCEDIKKVVPAPDWPNPDKEPLPPPVINSIIKKPPTRQERQKITNYSIWTELPVEQIESAENQDENQDEKKEPQMTDKQTRWVLQPKETKKLFVKFFSTQVGNFKQILQFEIVGSYKPFNLTTNAICEFPQINQNYRNLYLNSKKQRPPTEPESFLHKTFVISEGVFDFGPLLIGKNPEKRNEESVKAVNGTFFQITNNGKYDLQANFTLRSTLPAEEGGPSEKSPFIIEPQEATLKVDETLNLWVYAFPEEAKLYKDEVICLIKDNPNPATLPVQCLGAKPIVEVDQETVKFERALLGKQPVREFVLKNACAIPVNWKLNGVDKLPEEFKIAKVVAKPKEEAKPTSKSLLKRGDTKTDVSKPSAEDILARTSGTLEPGKSINIEVQFNALKEQKFFETLKLEVEDVENQGKKQEDKSINIDAEAFKITLNEAIQTDLDFGSVRVGEPKELPLYLKNQGQYPITYEFKMKKATTRQIFTITPMQGKLDPNEDINVQVKFLSQTEKKMEMYKTPSEISLVILEGEQQQIHQQIPINVSVNAVYSQYTISPLRNLNFGPLQYSHEAKRTFEIKNTGIFEFKYNICDMANEEEKQKIREERQKEIEGRVAEQQEAKEETKGKGKKAEPKGKPPAKGGKAEAVPEGTVINVSQFSIQPAVGSIPSGSSAIVTVTFNAQGSKFFDNTLCIDIANRNPEICPEGIPFQLCAESCIPSINTNDFDQIFEEQTVIPSLDPAQSKNLIVQSALFSQNEKVFWFGTMIASKNPEGTRERFKIINPNKIPCTVKFSVKPRSQSKSEGFAFDVQPDGLTIEPHKHKYVTIGFNPTAMMQYSGIFEAVVDQGDPESKTGRLLFELRGEGTLPTLQIQNPTTYDNDGVPILKFTKTRIGRDCILPIVLKNEGQVPATARFDAITNESFIFEGNMNQTITQKSYHTFDIKFKPNKIGNEKFMLTFATLNNHFEQHRVCLMGEGFNESILFEELPEDLQDELIIGDCVIGKAKAQQFLMVNNGEKDIKFRWSTGDKDEFKFYPTVGHLKAKQSKRIKVMVRGTQPIKYDRVDMALEVNEIVQTSGSYQDWDDTMKTLRMVRPSEYRKIMKQREEEERARKEAAEAAAAAATKGKGKAPPPKAAAKKDDAQADDEIVIDESEEPTAELIEVIPEPEHTESEEKKTVVLKTSCVIDYANYSCTVENINFKPTLMYGQRTFKFTVKNTSLINLNYNFKITDTETGALNAGPYSILPKQGTIAPGCDDNFIVKFNPLEVENDMSRLLSANIQNLNPEAEKLIIMVDGIVERPIIHFELPAVNTKADVANHDERLIEFDSLGTNIKNTKRFMAVNPTASGYEFEWEEVLDDSRQKPAFKCITPKGLILSGKKSEMTFEYTPESIGEQKSKWIFKIPSENITQTFVLLGRVNEPNVSLSVGKIKFGPLLLEGKNKETVQLVNQEHIPFAFNFSRESVRGSPDYGNSLQVQPMTGVVPPNSSLPIQIQFSPKYELQYNYNIVCQVKRKDRPLVLNVKGEGYRIHHSVFADEPKREVTADQPFSLNFGDFYINEKKTKKVLLTNNGEFNFDFVWRRQVNKYIKITPETGTVRQGDQVEILIDYCPISEHSLKDFKLNCNIVSGPKYEFHLNGKARKPGVKLNAQTFDFGSCFVTSQPAPLKKMLEITNNDSQAISLESNFEKTNYLDFQVVPGQVLMPGDKLEIPILFTPRELKKYQETIKLDFDGLYQVDINVVGQGISLNLGLKDPEQQNLDLGIVPVGGQSDKVAQIINRSSKVVKFKVFPKNQEQFDSFALTMKPAPSAKEIVLKPKETLSVEFRFKPKQRFPDFDLPIMIKVDGEEEARQLLALKGTAHGIEVKIMDEVLEFGSVVKDSRLTKSLQISNFGDVKANFEWDKKTFSQNFSISPVKGFINPNSNLDLEITFHPKLIDSGIAQKAICQIQGADPINLTLMGKCIGNDASQTQELNFQSVVRKTNVQSVTIQNTEEREWSINPTISTKTSSTQGYFDGKPTLIVPARGSAVYEIIYQPKTMTQTKKAAADSEETVPIPHEGSIFFPLPNGTALLYNLKGVATQPEAEGTITETADAKIQKNFILKVSNKNKTTQRFNAEWKVEGETGGLFIRGAKMFDVAGESFKEYKLNFLALIKGVYKFTATFKQPESGEYQFYNLNITVQDNSKAEVIEITSQIRESVLKSIVLENPTDQEVQIHRSQFICQNEYIEIHPETLILKPHDSRDFQIRYLPLMISEQEADLTLKNPILGDFYYKLKLKGIASKTQKSLAFKCSLGQDQLQTFQFVHFLKKATQYAVKVERIDGPGVCDFKAEVANVPAAAAENQKGVPLACNIRYEPFTIGDSRGVLKLTSPEGMEYTCLLFGKSLPPQPQGPIKCPAGAKPMSIDFKNPLNEKCEFTVTFDNPNFSLASKLPGPLEPGKAIGLQIKFEAKADLPSTGRMIVTTKGLPPWIYYLQGE